MKIFVTGITGFIGSHLWEFFSPADEIYLLTRRSVVEHPAGLNVTILQGDLASQDVFERLKEIRPEVCLHLAWEGIPDFGYEMSFKNLQHSSALLRRLVEECGCRKIIVGGSCFEYGKSWGICRETDEVASNSYFTWAKQSLCGLGFYLAAKHGVSFVWFRFFYVYGPNQRRNSLIPTLASTLLADQAPAVKTPLNANDFVYVKDICEGLALAARKNIPTGIYNLGSGMSVPVWKVCEVLERTLGRQPHWALHMKSSTTAAAADFYADTSKTKAVLGWTAKTPLDEGLQHYFESLETA